MNFRSDRPASGRRHLAQLGKLEERNQVRRDNAAYLVQRLAGHPALRPPEIEPGTDDACYILKWRYRPAPGMPDRDAFVAAVEAEGVPLCAGYTRLLYQNPVFSRRGTVRPAACPRSEQINREFVWFAAVHPPNTREDMDDVVEAIDKVLSWPGF